MNSKDQKLKSALIFSYGAAIGLTVVLAVISVVVIFAVANGLSVAVGAFITVIAAAAVVVISAVAAAVTGGSVVSGYGRLCAKAGKISEGSLRDDIGEASDDSFKAAYDALDGVKASIISFVDDISKTSKLIENGETNTRLDESKYNGAFVSAAESVNNVIDSLVSEFSDSVGAINSLADGDFDSLSDSAESSVSKISSRLDILGSDMEKTAEAIKNGRFDCALNTDNYPGDWKKIAACVNSIVNNVKAPLDEAAHILQSVAEGRLDVSFNCDYNGDFALIKSGIENSVSVISSHLTELADILNEISEHNFSVSFENAYPNSFSPIKEALDLVISSFVSLVNDMTESSKNFNNGTRRIVKSSIELAEGLSQQMSNIDVLNDVMVKLSQSTNENNNYANEANKLALITKKNTSAGTEQMNLMLNSMTEISNASTGIANIIKVIEDIAFQTNILALNASVEAARAGQHGKGFSVVAEEVRNLATRSHNAAQETSVLIEDSLRMISEGSENANRTYETLGKILSEIDNMSALIQKCADTSAQQEKAVKEITEDIGSISKTLLANSNASRSSADEARRIQELAFGFNTVIENFKIKNNKNEEDTQIKNENTDKPAEVKPQNKQKATDIKSSARNSSLNIEAKEVKPETKQNTANKKASAKVSPINIEAKEIKPAKADAFSEKATKTNASDSDLLSSEEAAAAKNDLHNEIEKLNSLGESQPEPSGNKNTGHFSYDKAPSTMTESKPVLKGLNPKAKVKPEDEADESEFNRSDFGKY